MKTDEFTAWWARNHPWDWWAKDRDGEPLSSRDRLLVWSLVKDAYERNEATPMTTPPGAQERAETWEAVDTKLVNWITMRQGKFGHTELTDLVMALMADTIAQAVQAERENQRVIIDAYRAHHEATHPGCNIDGPSVPPIVSALRARPESK